MTNSGISLPTALKGTPKMTNSPGAKPESASKDANASPVVAPAAPVTDASKAAPPVAQPGHKI